MKYYTITVNGVAYEVAVEENTNGSAQVNTTPKAAAPAPVAAPTPVTAAPAPAPAPKSAAPSGSQGNVKVESPMPGKILSIKVSVGQAVNRGDVILILEAMKMENEIVAAEAGTVASINVTSGDMVESGTLLATLN